MKRDKKGRFTKDEGDDDERFNLCVTLPSLETILFFLIS